jgi:nicotinamidase-related amidase
MGLAASLELAVNIPRLTASSTALVVIDVQERLLPAIHEKERLVAHIRLLLRTASALDVPVMLTTQYAKGLGPTVAAVTELAGPAVPIDKLTFSAFGSTDFARALATTGREKLLLCGIEAHVCVLQTGLDALAAGYQVHVAADATESRTAENAELGRRRLERAGAVLSSAEMAVYELLCVSGTPAFKSLLPYFK